MNNRLRVKNDDPLYRLLREGKLQEFNEQVAQGVTVDLILCDFRGVDFRGLQASGLDFSGCYFRQADLRGIDFSHCNLEGASINSAKISGTLFPTQISPAEIELSLLHGTRMRYNTNDKG